MELNATNSKLNINDTNKTTSPQESCISVPASSLFSFMDRKKEYFKKYRKENQEKARKYLKEWKKNNPEKVKLYSKKEWLNNKEKLIKRHKEYRKNNSKKEKIRALEYFNKNKIKILEAQRIWKKNNPDKIKQYRKNYKEKHPEMVDRKNFRTKACFLRGVNLSYEEFQELLKKQKYLCAICGRPETVKHKIGTKSLLSIDHDHKTNKVRGLLCRKCNSALGFLNDDIKLVLKAYNYLKTNL